MLSNNKNCIGAPVGFRAAYEVQQDLAFTCALHSEIIWDVLAPDQSETLIKKLECMLPYDKNIYTSKNELRAAAKHNASVKEIRVKLYRNIWQQRKYTNEALLHSIIYVLVTPELDIEKARYSHNYTIHPVFRTRRCINTNSSAGCCMIFIDETSRIYQNWNDFVNNNIFTYGIMIAPKNGIYSLNNNNEVELEYFFTPAYSYQTLTKIDNIMSIVSVVGQAATLFFPLFSVLAIGSKTYTTVRDYQKMSDEVKRGTERNLNANLNLTGNIISLTSSVATFGAYMAVPNGGELSVTAGISIQAINSGATLINCSTFIVTIYDLFTRYLDGEELNFHDVLEFSSSLILLTHSINNIVIISQIGKVGGFTLRGLLQSEVKAGLTLVSEGVKKYACKNTVHIDVLRLLNDIPYKDVLCNLHTIYTNLKQTGFLSTLSVLGAGVMEIISGLMVVDKEITELNFPQLSKHYGSKFVQHIANSQNLINVLNGIGLYFSETVLQFLLNQTRMFIDTEVEKIDSQQGTFITTEMILYKMFIHIIENYKDYTYEFLHMKRNDIILGVTDLFKLLNPKSTDKSAKKYDCDVCGGYYYLTGV